MTSRRGKGQIQVPLSVKFKLKISKILLKNPKTKSKLKVYYKLPSAIRREFTKS